LYKIIIMNIRLEDQIGEIVAHDYRTAAVFKAKGIDFCCRGNRTLQEAIQEKGLHAESLIEELKQVEILGKESTSDYENWPLDLLIDYIEKKHHRYIRRQVPVLTGYLEHVMKAHGESKPELREIQALFLEGSAELLKHIEEEEAILFPMIKDIVSVPLNVASVSCVPLNFFKQIMAQMKSEHATEGDRWQNIAQLTNYYQLSGCNTMRVTYSLLKEFQDDLFLHIHLENNILFPAAIELKNRKVSALLS